MHWGEVRGHCMSGANKKPASIRPGMARDRLASTRDGQAARVVPRRKSLALPLQSWKLTGTENLESCVRWSLQP